MNQQTKNSAAQPDEDYKIYWIILVLLSFPMGMIVGRFIPEIILPIKDGVSIHGYVSTFIAFVLLSVVLKPIKKLISVIALVTAIVLVIMVWRGDVTKQQITNYYKLGVTKITQYEIAGRSINNQLAIESAIDDDTGVMDFVGRHEEKYLYTELLAEPILKSFALFDKISRSWNYKHDPDYRELFRPPSETIKTKTGDCDDHAICLATCMKSCGARTRIVHAERHLYPELYVGSVREKERIVSAIHKLYPQSKRRKIHFVEDDGELWLNMDYTAKYPGGKYLSDVHYERLEL